MWRVARPVAQVEAHVVESADFKLNVTISCGVSTSNADMADAYALMKAADEAVYKAKKEGRNCVRIAAVEDARLPRSA